MSHGKYNLPVIKSLLLHHSKVSLPPLPLTAIVVPETYLYKKKPFFFIQIRNIIVKCSLPPYPY